MSIRRAFIQERFNDYRLKVIHPNAPNRQGAECRRAFIAGAATVMALLGEAPDEDAQIYDYVEGLATELKEMAERERTLGLGA